jgi:hypothetical protein
VADPAAVHAVDLAIDTPDAGAVLPFWRTLLAHDTFEEGELVDPQRRWSPIWFHQMDAPRPLRNRIHPDVFVPGEVAAERIAAAVAAGGHVTYDEQAPRWVTVADVDDNEADVATWADYETDLPGDLLTPRQFEQADGVDDWQVLQGASTYYSTASFAQGVDLVAAAASLADRAGKPLLADLRYPGVTLRLGTPEDGWLDPGFLELARQVQAAALGLGLVAEPTVARDLMLTIRRARHRRSPGVLGRRPRLRGTRRRGPVRPAHGGPGDLVPADGRSTRAAQPDPRGRVRPR